MLWPQFSQRKEKALLVGIQLDDADREDVIDSLAELKRLAETAGASVEESLLTKRDRPTSNFFIGSGKAKEIAEICREKKIDLIVTQAPFISGLVGYLLAKKFKTKMLLHFHGDYLFNKFWLSERKINIFLLPLAKFLAKRADGIRVMSPGIKEKLIKIGVKANKIKVINTPVNVEKFEKPNSDEVQKIKDKYKGKKIALFVGRLEEVKDLPTLFKGFKIAHEK